MSLPSITQDELVGHLWTFLVATTGFVVAGQVRQANTDALRVVRVGSVVYPMLAYEVIADLPVGIPGEFADVDDVLTVLDARQAMVIFRGVGEGSGPALQKVSTMLWAMSPEGRALRAAGVTVQAVREVRDVSVYLTQATEPRWEMQATFGYVREYVSTALAQAAGVVVDAEASGALEAVVPDAIVIDTP